MLGSTGGRDAVGGAGVGAGADASVGVGAGEGAADVMLAAVSVGAEGGVGAAAVVAAVGVGLVGLAAARVPPGGSVALHAMPASVPVKTKKSCRSMRIANLRAAAAHAAPLARRERTPFPMVRQRASAQQRKPTS